MATNAIFTDRATTTPINLVGEKVHFLLEHTQTGNYEVYLHDGPEGSGPPLHSHPWDETFYVIEGKVDFVSENAKKVLGPGELAHIPAGVAHSFRYLTPVQILSISMTDGAKKLFSNITKIVPGKMDGVSDATLQELQRASGIATLK